MKPKMNHAQIELSQDHEQKGKEGKNEKYIMKKVDKKK